MVQEYFRTKGHLDQIDHTYVPLMDAEDHIIGCKITLRGRVPRDINIATTDFEVLVTEARESSTGLW